ncbi:4'-phosphopantetheinyl transferase family protein [Pedobacter rhodius]|uniref:4'-phosphopantetheinyl transferase superfamily protein n=1 Tax=Pedobacter rhodius TaxID=3004098 RepID=A0ABT4L157_9SPHI|nr:4'-phosphopantetheinyl transferase superfamily protein [Pedobacter sp. SJ11]MCZ4224915.1 4'-phosphopantetheinyl transferase superfamily protein [Pedobacter sp. SJ11]
MIKVYYACFEQRFNDEKLHQMLRQLPTEIQNKILKFRNWQDIQRSLLGKLLLKKGLQDSGYESTLSNLQYNTYGRPFLEGYPDFNITHSGNYAACAVSTQGTVGIDLELIRPVDLHHFESQFSKIEWQHITDSEDTISKFFQYWTIKEAVIKADGRGMSLPLNSFIIREAQVNVLDKAWHYKALSYFPGHQAHIASEQPLPADIAANFELF